MKLGFIGLGRMGRIWASPGESVGAIFRIVLPSKREAEVDQIRS